jgi:hypothetical protein
LISVLHYKIIGNLTKTISAPAQQDHPFRNIVRYNDTRDQYATQIDIKTTEMHRKYVTQLERCKGYEGITCPTQRQRDTTPSKPTPPFIHNNTAFIKR